MSLGRFKYLGHFEYLSNFIFDRLILSGSRSVILIKVTQEVPGPDDLKSSRTINVVPNCPKPIKQRKMKI